jgi:hypothetical protein
VRWVRKDRRVYDFSLCRRCGTAGGCGREGCAEAKCKACGTVQCSGNGLGRGTCSVCHVGLLPGWSGHNRPCGYKGCVRLAVALAPRIGRCCEGHLRQAKLDVCIAERLAERANNWEEIE